MPHTPRPRGPTAEGFSTLTDSGVGLIIEHTTTVDMPDGQPLPPYIDDDGAVWGVVRHLPGARTLWRRVRLSSKTSSEHAIDRRPVALAFNAAAATRKK
jgi:hypothetical protein